MGMELVAALASVAAAVCAATAIVMQVRAHRELERSRARMDEASEQMTRANEALVSVQSVLSQVLTTTQATLNQAASTSIIEQQHFLLPYLVYFRIDDITHLINIFIIDTVFFQFQNFRGQRLTQVQDGTSSEVREDYFIRHFLAHFIRSIYFLCFR